MRAVAFYEHENFGVIIVGVVVVVVSALILCPFGPDWWINFWGVWETLYPNSGTLSKEGNINKDEEAMNDNKIPILMPFMGEFGSKLAKHCTGVRGAPRPLIICHEEGEEPIYPDATERWTYNRPEEDLRKAGGHINQKEYYDAVRKHFGSDRHYIESTIPFKWPQKYFVPEHTGNYDHIDEFDVLLFPRKKEYAHGRNWQYWKDFYLALKAEGIKCMVGGQPDSTQEIEDCPAIWHYVDDKTKLLDATIWAIKKSMFRIGTATGTTFLSIMCNKPMILIIGDNGMDALGSKNGFNSGSYFKLDDKRVGWRVVSHWGNPQYAIREFLEIYQDQELFEAQCREWITGIHVVYAKLEERRAAEVRDFILLRVKRGAIDLEPFARSIGYSVEFTGRICNELTDEGRLQRLEGDGNTGGIYALDR